MRRGFVRRCALAAAVVLGAAWAAACGGEAALGEACEEEGAQEGECEDGTVCAKPDDGGSGLACLQVCDDQDDCPADEECNGVSDGSVKACRPKKDGDDGSGGKNKG